MAGNIIILIVFFSIILIVLRGYMGLTVRLALSKKERKKYKESSSLVNRWFFCSTHRVIKDKYDKYEKRTIRYTLIMVIYKYMTIALHCSLLALIMAGLLVYVSKTFCPLFEYACWICTGSDILSILVLSGVALYEGFRYHKNRYV